MVVSKKILLLYEIVELRLLKRTYVLTRLDIIQALILLVEAI